MDGASTVRIIPVGAAHDGEDAPHSAALVIMRGPDLGRRFLLQPGSTIIGRHADATITIDDRSISRRHCEIRVVVEQGHTRYVLRELGSTNGTLVNGQRAAADIELIGGDRLNLGDVVLKFMLLDTVEDAFHDELTDLLRTDRQTGLLHIDAFYADLDRALARARDAGEPLAVLMLDIDGLKTVNDGHGHLVGSEVVRTVAARLREACGAARGVPAVYGGDEFILYLPASDEAAALALADGVRAAIATGHIAAPGGQRVSVTLSGGVAEFPRDGGVRAVLVRRADIALYAAKRAGRDRVLPFRPDMESADESTEKITP